MIILQEHAREAIIEEFAFWAKNYPRRGLHTAADGALYFQHLRSTKADLLEFRCPYHNKWDLVKKWLVEADLISD